MFGSCKLVCSCRNPVRGSRKPKCGNHKPMMDFNITGRVAELENERLAMQHEAEIQLESAQLVWLRKLEEIRT
ncbi:MAG: hypothetical protein EZS28_044389 [Streblomastix strix]|uniref:Uncharacterized protein n=1 Tax=Streblomastix strix TaxID=222440 RepID=A0A5J4TNR4_9EUKA|nr:MAG: hypothetical protein EZS28_044389 [Streblomastix strix]